MQNLRTVYTLATDDKYSLLSRDNLTQPIQMQLSKEQKKISEFLFPFLKFRLNFVHFRNKDDSHSLCISDIADCEKHG